MAATTAPLPRRGRTRLYRAAALLALAIVFAGFARTFFLKFLFHAPPPLSMLTVAHGSIMTAWFVLFIVQTQLVAAGNVRLHRRLGVAGMVLAALVLVAGSTTAIIGARLGHTPGPPPRVFLTVPLGDMVVFGILVGAAFAYRRRGDYHKRLMVLAFAGMITAAVARIPGNAPGNIIVSFVETLLFCAACVAWDTWRERRLHPAFAWGFAVVAISWPLRLWLSGTPAWQSFAAWLGVPG
jgi:FtsH-binding integral membrane protein